MALDKYLKPGSTGFPEVATGIDQASGGDDSGKIVHTNEDGKIDVTLLPEGVGPDVIVAVASENLTAGQFVYLWYDSDTLKCAKAIANDFSKRAVGFVLENYETTDIAKIYCEGRNTVLNTLNANVSYFLSADTAGAATITPPTANDTFVQELGMGGKAQGLVFEPTVKWINPSS